MSSQLSSGRPHGSRQMAVFVCSARETAASLREQGCVTSSETASALMLEHSRSTTSGRFVYLPFIGVGELRRQLGVDDALLRARLAQAIDLFVQHSATPKPQPPSRDVITASISSQRASRRQTIRYDVRDASPNDTTSDCSVDQIAHTTLERSTDGHDTNSSSKSASSVST